MIQTTATAAKGIALTLLLGGYMPAENPVPARAFDLLPRYDYVTDRALLRSERRSVPLRKLIDDYVLEIQNGDLYRIGNSIMFIEDLVKPENEPSVQASLRRDTCIIELAIARQKILAGNKNGARVFLSDAKRLLQQQRDKLSGDDKYLRKFYRQLFKQVKTDR